MPAIALLLMRVFSLACCLILFWAIPSRVIPAAGRRPDRFALGEGDYWRAYLSDTGAVISAPLDWNYSEWLAGILVAGTTVGIYFSDQDIWERIQDNETETGKDIARISRQFGESYVTLPTIALFYLYGEVFDNRKARKTGLLCLEAFLISNLFTQSLKYGSHRSRPNSGEPYDTWGGASFSSDPNGGSPDDMSFPSGHTTSVFALATVIASEYDETWVVPAFCYSIAALTGLSRIYEGDHWASDVFFGAAVGFFTGRAIVKRHSDPSAEDVSLFPFYDGKIGGLMIGGRF